jgi:hypothetical protein
MKPVAVFAALLVAVFVGAVAQAQDKVGVEVCDNFLDKYQACIKDKGGDQRPQLEQMVGQLRTQWKQLADNPQTRGALEQACKTTIDTVKPTLNAAPYNCGF